MPLPITTSNGVSWAGSLYLWRMHHVLSYRYDRLSIPVRPFMNSAPGSALPACYLLTADLVEISLFLVCNLAMLAPLTFHHWARLLHCTTRLVLLSAYCAYLSIVGFNAKHPSSNRSQSACNNSYKDPS